jgi:hypothetical protein
MGTRGDMLEANRTFDLKNKVRLNAKKWFAVYIRVFSLCILFFLTKDVYSQITQTYNSSGSFTVPNGVSSLTVECWGAGGGGGGSSSSGNGGSGGGGGGYTTGVVSVTAGQVITFTVGTGGTAGAAAGGDGGSGSSATTFLTLRANAGTGGGGNQRAAGTGGTASGGTTNISGDNGSSGGNSGGDGGAGANGGAGGNGNSNASGGNGTSPGGGGGGGERGGGSNYAGGKGAAGQIRLTYNYDYLSEFASMNIGSNSWIAGETRNVSVTVKNIGAKAWTDNAPDINIGVKWNGDPDYLVRVNAGNLAPGATQTYNFTVTAPSLAGTNNLTFDVVNEGSCWFGNNSGTCGPGNSVYVSGAITITPVSGYQFTTSGNYVVPMGVTSLKVECWGGGGGGSSVSSSSLRGGGGGGGAYSMSIIPVTPGNVYSVVVGNGGAASSAGGNSSFGNTLVVAAGGGGATSNSTTRGLGGSIAASTGTVRYAGGNGANGDATANFSGAGGGGAGSSGNGGNASGSWPGIGTSMYGGNGGSGVSGSANGITGFIYGGGGSGAVTNSTTPRTGGSGGKGLVVINLPAKIALSSAAQVSAANVLQGTNKLPLSAFETAVSDADGKLSKLSFTSAGSYIGTDITRFQLWYNTSNDFAGASQLGSDITSSLASGIHTFNFSVTTYSGTTGYFWITADIPQNATPNATLSVNAITPSDFTYELASVTGTTTDGGVQTIQAVPRVILASAGQVVAANVNQGTKNQQLYRFTTEIQSADAVLKSLAFVTAGSYSETDIVNLKLWHNTTNNFTSASQVGSPIIGGLGNGSHSFSNLNLTINAGTTGYFWITADIAPFPTNNVTIRVNAVTTADLTYSFTVFKSGTATAGGDQTIKKANGIYINSTYPAVSANSILQGSTNQNVYKFSAIVSGAAATISTVSFTTAGTYAAGDISRFKLFYNRKNSMIGATQLATITTGLGAGSHTFNGFSQSTPADSTAYFWITTDVVSTATPGKTISVKAITPANITAGVSVTGSTFDGGVQTIQLKIDSDGDGVADVYDLDDDNDGLPDDNENSPCNNAVAELFPNSNFEAGVSGFSTGYKLNTTSLYDEGVYAITPNAHNYHNDFQECPGHGNMMVVNGSPNPNLIVWSSGTIDVTPNTDYTLTIQLTSVNPANPAQLIFNVNGENIGLQFNATTTNCEWKSGIAVWNSGSNTKATFDIMNLNLIPGGNDFAIDDVSCKYKVNCDSDGDGVPDKLDLDSDNDGIYDVVEVGGTADANGNISGFADIDKDGLSDNVDKISSGLGGTDYSGGTPLVDINTDGDLLPNRIDTDSDGDLCPDTKEAGLPDPDVDGKLGPSPVIVNTSNGKVTSAVGYTNTFPDADNNGTKDYVQKMPYITTQPVNKTLCLPTAGTSFTVVAVNTNGTFVWQVSKDNGASWSNLANNTVYSGVNTATLTISSAVDATYDGYQYRLQLPNDAYNCFPLSSNAVTLKVYGGVPVAPDPIVGNATVCSGVSQVYSIPAMSTATSYTWTVPTGWTITSGNGTTSIVVTTGASNGTIAVTSSNYCGSGGTRSLPVTISAPLPTFTTPTAGATVCQSADITYTTQSGKSNYVWNVVGGSVGVDYIITSGGTSTDNTIKLKWLTTGVKTVSVNYTSGGCAGLTAATVNVTVNANAMVLTQPVAPAPICAGAGSVSLSITAQGATSYQWQVSTDNGSTWSNLADGGYYSGVKTATMTITNPPVSFDNYKYQCEITGSCGAATSFSVPLTVNGVAITSQATNAQTVCIGVAFSPITVTAQGSGLTYQWFSNGTASNTGGIALGSANGAQTASYTPPSSASGTKYYYCVVTSSGCGSATSAISGAHIVNPVVAINPFSPASSSRCQGAATVNVSTTASNSTGISYSLDAASLSAGNTINAATGAVAFTSGWTGNSTITASAAGCSGPVTTSLVIATNAKTVINTESLVSQKKCVGNAFTPISVTASGTGTIKYQWYKNTLASTSGGIALGTANGAQTSTYTPQSSSVGVLYYYCIVTGDCGNVTSSISGVFETYPVPDTGDFYRKPNM